MALYYLSVLYVLLTYELALGDASAILSYEERQQILEASATDFKNYTNYTEPTAPILEDTRPFSDNGKSPAAVWATVNETRETTEEIHARMRDELNRTATLLNSKLDLQDSKIETLSTDSYRYAQRLQSSLSDMADIQNRVRSLESAGDLNQLKSNIQALTEQKASRDDVSRLQASLFTLNIVKVDGLRPSGSACTLRGVGGVPSAEACLKKCDEAGESGCRFALWNKRSTICGVVSPAGNKCSFSNHEDYVAIYRSKATFEYMVGDYRGGDIMRDNNFAAEKVTELQCRYACDLIPECNVCGWWISRKRCNVKTKNWNADKKTIDYVNHSDFVSWKLNK